MLEDVMGWAAVLVGAVVIHFTGWSIIDPILSLAIACFVLLNVYKNIRRVLPILMQGTPAGTNQSHIIEKLKEMAGVAGVHDLHVWSLDEEYIVLSVHLILERGFSIEELAGLKDRVRSVLRGEGVVHTTIEFELQGEKCNYLDCL